VPWRLPSRRGLIAALAAATLAFALVTIGTWLGLRRAGAGRFVEVSWPPSGDRTEGIAALAAAGVIDRPALFHALLVAVRPFVTPTPGSHLLPDDLTPGEILRRLSRLSSRARVRVVVPEGFNRFQVSARLEELGICSRRTFDAAVVDRGIAGRLGIAGDSAEGYLFPATYELPADSTAEAVVTELGSLAKKRWSALASRRAADFARLEAKYGWGERDIVTLASVVEKEAARADELPVIASVFFNRLDDPTFRPARSLQSDPTAGYGCLVTPELESCRGYAGRVTPAMLRDSANVYNTYRHPGLPPGPIANPGIAAVEGVLSPAATDFLFFVAAGDGRHVFTRTLEEHEAAIRRPR
jgi:UPF0755 protein